MADAGDRSTSRRNGWFRNVISNRLEVWFAADGLGGTAASVMAGYFTSAGAYVSTKAMTVGALVATTGVFSGLLTAVGIKSLSPTVPLGYGVGAGSAKVTQITSRATGVAVTTVTGQIQTDTSSLAAEASAVFIVTATGLITAADVVVVSEVSGSNGGNTDLKVEAVGAGVFSIRVSNNNASGGTAETGAIVINYAIIKGSLS